MPSMAWRALTRALAAAAAGIVTAVMIPAAGAAAPCTRTANDGTCGAYSYRGITASDGANTYVRNNVWNAVPGWRQKLTSHGPGNWSVTATMPRGNTAVASYPDVQQLYTTTADRPRALSSFRRIAVTFAEAGGGNGRGNDWEFAWDIWAGTGSSNYAQEIMIWADVHGQVPAGTRRADVTIMGERYQIWDDSRHNPVTLVLARGRAHGTVHILADLRWLTAHGYMPRGSGINDIEAGPEICSTGGRPETFQVTRYTLRT